MYTATTILIVSHCGPVWDLLAESAAAPLQQQQPAVRAVLGVVMHTITAAVAVVVTDRLLLSSTWVVVQVAQVVTTAARATVLGLRGSA